MPETLTRVDPIAAEPQVFVGGKMVLEPAAKRYSLRGAAADLQAFLPLPLPMRIGDISNGAAGLAVMLGPDEWLLIGELLAGGQGQPVSITEITERQIGLLIEGPRAAELLMSGCPLDLERMSAGRGTRTIYETVEITLLKLSETRFHVEVWRSFAPWLLAVLTQVAMD